VKRVNFKLLFGLLIGSLLLAGGLFGLNRYQVDRNAGGLAKLARQKLKDGKIQESVSLFNRYLGMRPDDVDVQREYAELVLEQTQGTRVSQADLQRAYNSLEEAVRRNPEDNELRLKLAEFQVRVGRVGDAREHLETLRSQPAGAADGEKAEDATKVQLLLARCLAGEGDFDSAARLAGDLIGYDVQQRSFVPDRRPVDETEPYLLLASVLEERLQDAPAADAVLEELGKRRANDAKAWLAISRWHRQRSDLDAATQDVDKALKLAPDDADVVWGSFELSLAKGDVATAKTTVDRARELFPGDERVYRGLAALALQRGDLPAAETALRDGVAQLPDKASLLLMLADTLLQQGKLDETDETTAQIEELFGTASPAVGLLQSRVLIARRRWSQARQRLEEIRPLAAGAPELIRQVDLALAQCYENLEEFDEQLDVSRRILVDDPGSLQARVTQASAMAAAGRTDDAIAEFETVAGALPPDRLAAAPQVWYPLLQLWVTDQIKRPAGERDWSRIDDLLAKLEQSTTVTAAQIALLRADILSRKGESDAALDLLERATSSGDAEPPLWSALAQLTLRERGPEATREVLARLPAERIDHPALMPIRIQLAAREAPEEAARELAAIEKGATAAAPEEAARLLSMLAGLQLELGNAADAERLWRTAAERQPDDLRSRTALLELAMKAGDVDKAKAAAADIEAVAGEKSARSLVAQAGVRILQVRQAQEQKELETGKVDLTAEEQRLLGEARNLLIEAENDRPGWQVVHTYAAEIDGLKGDIPSAIDRLQKAVKLGPANPDVVRQLVALLYASNRLDEARQALDTLGPDGLGGLERLSAEMELRSGRLDDAVAIAERTVNLDSKNGGELLWLGQLLERAGKLERAGELFNKAVDASPDRADAWLALFSHQLAAGRRRGAETTLDRAAQALQPPARQLVRARGEEMLGRLDDADRSLQEAAAASPDDIGIATARAEFLVRVGRTDAAMDSLRALIDSKTDNAVARGTKSWARRKLAELQANRGTYPEFREAMAMIDANVGEDGQLTAEDAAVKVALLANRPEPTSWQQAIEVLETLRSRQTLTTAQRLTLAGLLDKVGRWEESRQELMAIVAAPQTPPAFVAMLADKLITHGELDNGRSWVKRLQETAPNAPVTVALEARLAIADKDRARAADLARRLMPEGEVPTDQAGQLMALAKLIEDLGFPKAADKVLAQYAELSPEGVVARAEFLGRQRRTTEALDVLEKSWDTLSLERLLSVAMEALRTNPKAETEAARFQQWIKKARRIDPESVVVSLVEAEWLGMQDRGAEAEAMYRALLDRKDLEPVQAAIIANNLAFQLAQPKTAAEAKKLIDQAIGTLGPHPDLLDTRGLVLLALGEDREAVTDLQQAILQPSDVKYLHLAYAQFRTGDESAARTALESGRKQGLTVERLSAADRARLREIESALGIAPEQAGPDTSGAGRG
jgi:tetratricopeptide (TPR) repeat protein